MARYFKRIWLASKTGAPYGVGAFTVGNVLLVGEQAAKISVTTPEQRPFCSTQGCSGWLNRLLDVERIPEERLFWLNALDNRGAVIDIAYISELLKPRVVIALGNVAQHTCTEQRVPHVACRHPQYWKRFKHGQRYPLLNLLNEHLEKNIILSKPSL